MLDFTFAPTLAGRPIPSRPWRVTDWIPSRNVTMLGGDGGVGKSLAAFQLMVACASERPWFGLETTPCRAFGLFAEDDDIEMHIRLGDIARHYGVEIGDLDGLGWSARTGKPNVLMHFGADGRGQTTKVWDDFCARVVDFGAQMVVIDTLADAFSGNENARGQARTFVNKLRELAQRIDGAVVMTAHPSVAGMASGTGLSGSTAWNGSVRSRLFLSKGKDDEPDIRILERKKSNYSSAGSRVTLRWCNGVLSAFSPDGFDARMRRQSLARLISERVAAEWTKGTPLSAHAQAKGRYLPTLIANGTGYKVREVEDAMNGLLAAGIIETREAGKNFRGLFLAKPP